MHETQERAGTDRHGHLVGQTGSTLSCCSKGNRAQPVGEAEGPSSIRGQGRSERFGEGLASTASEVTEEAAGEETEDEREACPW